jgi:mannosyltransferase OCH1-like enzyme
MVAATRYTPFRNPPADDIATKRHHCSSISLVESPVVGRRIAAKDSCTVAMAVTGRFGRLVLLVSAFAFIALVGSGLYLGSERLDTIVPSFARPAFPKSSSTITKEKEEADREFPYPRKIWQTDKSIEVSKWKLQVHSWLSKNERFRYELLNDYGAESYVREMFADDIKIRDAYLETPDVILRSDMLRIMIMYASGGVYSDMDTECLVPITEWVPREYYGKANLVVGFETERSQEEGIEEEQRLEVKVCQWTLLAMEKSRHTHYIINHIVDNLHRLAEQKNVSFPELGAHLEIPEVISATGPAEVTVALLESLSESLGETIDRRNVTGYKKPFLLDDVLFLPVNAFAGHQVHSHSGWPELGPLLVKHYYGSSWWMAHGNEDEQNRETEKAEEQGQAEAQPGAPVEGKQEEKPKEKTER